jgi:hypothetical protein
VRLRIKNNEDMFVRDSVFPASAKYKKNKRTRHLQLSIGLFLTERIAFLLWGIILNFFKSLNNNTCDMHKKKLEDNYSKV